MRIFPGTSAMKQLYTQILLLALFLSIIKCSEYGLKWTEKCKIPADGEFLKVYEECDISKGLHCQVYQQGNLCGCTIRSSLSWDEDANECRRKPGHHCPYINSTDPKAYNHLPYNHKCHEKAFCMSVALIERNTTDSKPQMEEGLGVCHCKPGYVATRDGLKCVSSARVSSNKLVFISTLLLPFLVQPFT